MLAVRAHRLAFALLCSACAPCPCAVAPAPSEAGFRAPKYEKGAFTVSLQGGRAWFIAPDGQRFLSQGVNPRSPVRSADRSTQAPQRGRAADARGVDDSAAEPVSAITCAAPARGQPADIVELTLQIPLGHSLQVFLSEMGVAAPDLEEYAGRAGSDGESYEFPALTGTGKLETYTVSLLDLERRTSWGNQRGNQVLDLQALSAVDLDIPGKQGSGDIRVASIVFKHTRSLVTADGDQR